MLPISQPKAKLTNEYGFTLLEIIAVLVILSILAVVALPKYFNLQEQARDKAMKTALAEAIGRVNGYFAQQVLSGDTPDEIGYNATTLGSDLGDFSLSVTGGDASNSPNPFTLTVTGIATAVKDLTISTTIHRPGLPGT